MEIRNDVTIIGGGLAGLTAALHLAASGVDVLLVEKQRYPHHKVCGEYLSDEIIPYLDSLGADIRPLHPERITQAVFTDRHGHAASTALDPGGWGISRHALDHFLFKHGVKRGCIVMHKTAMASDFNYLTDSFLTQLDSGERVVSKVVLGCFGKRSLLDRKMDRKTSRLRFNRMAVKAHYQMDFPNKTVELHNFDGGYCGMSKTETGDVNVCYLADTNVFANYGNIAAFEREVVFRNPQLKERLQYATPVFEKPLTISQIDFSKKETVENHILMCGDSAGLIHPLCGNGMAMAIHAAKLASEAVLDFLHGKTTRREMETAYRVSWERHFRSRIRMGHALSSAMRHPSLNKLLMGSVTVFPSLLSTLIRRTHGEPVL